MKYDYITDGNEIYRRSFEIIEAESDLSAMPKDVAEVAVRMIHAAAQPDVAQDIAWSDAMVANTRAALHAGAPIFCDSQMVASGIIRSRLPKENEVICHLGDPGLAPEAARLGTTKTAAAVEWWLPRLEGSVVAIGNAPTALFHLLEVIAEHGVKPAGVIGIPVGFVGAPESKEALAANDLGVEYLVVRGRRGGSAITCAAVNALSRPGI